VSNSPSQTRVSLDRTREERERRVEIDASRWPALMSLLALGWMGGLSTSLTRWKMREIWEEGKNSKIKDKEKLFATTLLVEWNTMLQFNIIAFPISLQQLQLHSPHPGMCALILKQRTSANWCVCVCAPLPPGNWPPSIPKCLKCVKRVQQVSHWEGRKGGLSIVQQLGNNNFMPSLM